MDSKVQGETQEQKISRNNKQTKSMYIQRRIFRAWAHRNPLEETAPRAGPTALYQVGNGAPPGGRSITAIRPVCSSDKDLIFVDNFYNPPNV